MEEKEMNRSGVFMPKCFQEPEILSSKRDREKRNLRYVPPAPKPHNVRSVPSQSRLLHSRNESNELDTSFNLLMANGPNQPIGPHQTIFRQYFEIQERLGFGSFGDVFQVKSVTDGKLYAVKKSRRTYTGEGDRSRQLLEVQRVVHIPSHQHLVELERAWEEEGHLYLQMELCAKSLNTDIEDGHQFSETETWDVIIDMLLALHHLHTHHLVHMDVKPENMFLTMDTPPIYKLGDFGIVVSLEEKRDINEFTEGDSRYLAPEVMQGSVSTKADIFSLGLTILEIACHVDLPKGGQLWHQLRSGGTLPEPCAAELPISLRNIVELMITPDVTKRPDINEILQLPEVRKAMSRRRWALSTLYVKQKLKAIGRFWNRILSFLTSLMVIPRFNSAPTILDHSASRVTPECIPTFPSVKKLESPPEIILMDNSFSDEEEIPNYQNSSRNTTPVFASTPISHSGTRSAGRRSARSRRGELEQKLLGSPSTSRNLLKEFEAVSSTED